MKLNILNGFIVADGTWPEVRDMTLSKSLALQYIYDTSDTSTSPFFAIFSVDNPIMYKTLIYDGTVPPDHPTNQSSNDAYKSDFLTNWVSSSVQTTNFRIINPMSADDPRVAHKFGNMVSGTINNQELLVSARIYNEPGSEGQRSINSTSANDVNPAGSGAKAIRIVYLNSNYQKFTEDVLLNGTSVVTTTASNIRFIESLTVIKGAAAAGAIRLFTNNNGTGTIIAQISPATSDAFLCHHYVPTGSVAYVLGWGVTCDFTSSYKLTGQCRVSGNLVDKIFDLKKLHPIPSSAPTLPATIEFYKNLIGIKSDEATYIRITGVQNTNLASVTVRAYLDLWEVKK